MVSAGQKQEFFSKIMAFAAWDEIGLERIEQMTKNVTHVAESLELFVRGQSTFALHFGDSVRSSAIVDEPPNAWYAICLPVCKDKKISVAAYEFQAELFERFDRSAYSSERLQHLIQVQLRGIYLMTNFFLNDGNFVITIDPSTFTPWRTMTLKDGATVAEFAKVPGRPLLYYQNCMMEDQDFLSAPATKEIRIARVHIQSLGFPGHVTHVELMDRILTLGFFPCPPQLVPQLCKEYTDQPAGESLYAVMHPIYANRVLSSFRLTHNLSNSFVGVDNANPTDRISYEAEVLFCLDNPYPNAIPAKFAQSLDGLGIGARDFTGEWVSR